jgi:hypothetical protein
VSELRVDAPFFLYQVGTVVAMTQGMAARPLPSSSTPSSEASQRIGMVCWLFYRDNRALTCAIILDGDGF